MMKKYRTKPAVIEAIQWDGMVETLSILEKWIGKGLRLDPVMLGWSVILQRRGRRVKPNIGDWIIKDIQGELYHHCEPDIFEQTYEEVE